MRTLSQQEISAVSGGTTGCGTTTLSISICLPKIDLLGCFTGLLSKLATVCKPAPKTCKPRPPKCGEAPVDDPIGSDQ